jgi:hypothetical protein
VAAKENAMSAITNITNSIARELRRLADAGEIEFYPVEGDDQSYVVDGEVDLGKIAVQVALALQAAGHDIGTVSVITDKT